MYMEMVAHCLSGLPDEACGLLVGPYGGDEATHLFVTPNAAASAMVYEIDPTEMLRVDRAARALGADITGVFHSHTHTDPYPSPTDVAQATDPGWHYVLVSLRDTHPVVRSYRIVDEAITEEPVVVPGLDGPGLDGPDLAGPDLAGPDLEAPGRESPGLDLADPTGHG
jgi:[CysO sulfur-carrier protein]-S-L-cysteine hydrolase